MEIAITDTIIGEFDTRRSAELAVERIVQELQVPRDEVLVRPVGSENTAGTRPAGADAKAAPEPEGQEKLEGRIEVSVKHGSAKSEHLIEAMRAAGATDVRKT